MSAVGPLQRDPVTGKLMRDPVTNKLMRMTCHQCGRYTITFSGVSECDLSDPCNLNEDLDGWPSDLNTTFILTYDGDTGGWQHEWSASAGGWCICLTCDVSSKTLRLYAGYTCGTIGCTNDIAIAFGANYFSIAGGVVNNKITSGDCCTTEGGNTGCEIANCGGDASATGYSGTASIVWDNTGC